MSTRSWDKTTVAGCLAELEYQREAFLRIHDLDCREKRSLEKRAKRAEAKLQRLHEQLNDLIEWSETSEPLFSARQGTPAEIAKRERERAAGRIKMAIASAAVERPTEAKP